MEISGFGSFFSEIHLISVEAGEGLSDTSNAHEDEDERWIEDIEDVGTTGSVQVLSWSSPSPPAYLQVGKNNILTAYPYMFTGALLFTFTVSHTLLLIGIHCA